VAAVAREIHVPQPPLSETKKGPQDGLPATLGKIGFAEDYKTGAQANAS